MKYTPICVMIQNVQKSYPGERERLIMQTNLKLLPTGEQPDQKAERYGFETLSDAELLSIIIRTGTKEENCLELCHQILNRLGGSITGLSRTNLTELRRFHGVGRVKALQLLCITELSRRIWKTRTRDALSFHSPELIYLHYREDFRYRNQEVVFLLLLDAKCRLISEEELSRGTICASLISPREIFLTALQKNAVNLILLHNHPSGDPTPSKEDIAITKTIYSLGKMMQLPLMDHIILGDTAYYSMKESGMI